MATGLSNSNEYGQLYRFGFQSADAPTGLPGTFIPRSAEIRYEPEVWAQGTNRGGHAIAIATTDFNRRKITGQFTGYVTPTFDPSSVAMSFTFVSRTFIVRHVGNMRRRGDFNECVIDAESYYFMGDAPSPIGLGVSYGGAVGFYESFGELTTDIYGLQTCETTIKWPQFTGFNTVPSMFDSNPFFPWLHLERQRTYEVPGFLITTGSYAGVAGGQSAPIYELSLGIGEEPIETHPKFESEIAGTPSQPLNGAWFIDPDTGELTKDDSKGVFDHFLGHIGTGLNPFAGITSYANLSNSCWRVRYVSTTRPSSISTIGYIGDPEGPVPTLPANANWLYMGTTYEQRGLAFFITKEWKASGPRGWNQIIYTP